MAFIHDGYNDVSNFMKYIHQQHIESSLSDKRLVLTDVVHS